jgi:serine/threonine-protein kinase RsbW|tara:strand:- start:49 stop:459 length:411 start_codon:yes stop_codon:yes gene_type:complete
MTFEEHKEFPVDSASLKDVRTFAREVLAKDEMFNPTKDDVVLAIAEAAQNIVKHAYSGEPTGDTMRVEISFKENQLKIDLYDKGKPAIPQNIKPRQIDDIKPGGLGTFFIGQIMDEVIFKTSASDWVNHLILTKNY